MITITPATELTLEQFLEQHDVHLEVRELGCSDGWEAKLSPEVWQGIGGSSYALPERVLARDQHAALEAVCRNLSGYKLKLADSRRPIDHSYTRVVVASTPGVYGTGGKPAVAPEADPETVQWCEELASRNNPAPYVVIRELLLLACARGTQP